MGLKLSFTGQNFLFVTHELMIVYSVLQVGPQVL